MKYIIKESKLNNFITEYIDSIYSEEINWVYGSDFDDDGFEDPDIENEERLIFYTGDWEGEYDSNVLFNYITKEFYADEPSRKPFRDSAPILLIVDDKYDTLNSMFGDYWKEPMKQWFENKFHLPVKTITND